VWNDDFDWKRKCWCGCGLDVIGYCYSIDGREGERRLTWCDRDWDRGSPPLEPTLGWFQWQALPPMPEVVLPGGAYLEWGGDRVWAFEAVQGGRYRPCWRWLGRYRLVGSARVTVCLWSWWAVTMWWVLIGPFKFKFYCLNTNLTFWIEKLTIFYC
jgi:hypothetical protein